MARRLGFKIKPNNHKPFINAVSDRRMQYLKGVPKLNLPLMDRVLISSVTGTSHFYPGQVIEISNSDLVKLARRGLILPHKFLLYKKGNIEGKARV